MATPNIIKYSSIQSLLIAITLVICGCSRDSYMEIDEVPVVNEIDSFRNLTPCMIEAVTDFKTFVASDTFPWNDEYGIDWVLYMDIDTSRYYWIQTNWEDETEIIYNQDCGYFCKKSGWTGFDALCHPAFKDSIWTIAWQR